MDLLFGSIDLKEKLRERDTQLTIALILVFAIGFGSYKLYNWHNFKIQSRAQKAFNESMDIYKQALTLELGNKKEEKNEKSGVWDEVEVSFKMGYEQNQSSTLAPFFLAFESEAQLKLGKFDEAYQNLTKAIGNLSKKSPYYYLYSIKQALMEINKEDNKYGIDHLNELVNNNDNIFKDMAAFYLGEYYWSINDIDKAKDEFQKALAFNPESTWGNLSRQRLEKLG